MDEPAGLENLIVTEPIHDRSLVAAIRPAEKLNSSETRSMIS